MSGSVYVISAPSSAGKTTLVRALMHLDGHCINAISFTTRAPRGQEINGREYYFISHEEFEEKIQQDFFWEYAKVHGNYYGLGKSEVLKLIKDGKDVLIISDVKGAKTLKNSGLNCISIFIAPPSMNELQERIIRRNENVDINERMQAARFEIERGKSFDYVIVNERFETALFNLKSIIQSNRLRSNNYQDFLSNLLDGHY